MCVCHDGCSLASCGAAFVMINGFPIAGLSGYYMPYTRIVNFISHWSFPDELHAMDRGNAERLFPKFRS